MKKEKICSICKNTYTGLGNNAIPINSGRCCDKCNKDIVVPIRLGIIVRSKMKKL